MIVLCGIIGYVVGFASCWWMFQLKQKPKPEPVQHINIEV